MATADIQSMTGFASARRVIGGVRHSCDIRSVNGRSLDVKLRLPPGLEAHEAAIRKQVGGRIARGNLQITIGVEAADMAEAVAIDADAFRALAAQAMALSVETGLAPPTTDGLLPLRGVVVARDRLDGGDGADGDEIAALVGEALDGLVKARLAEGAAMAALVAGHVDAIEALVARASADAESRPEAIRARLSEQIGRLLADTRGDGLDPARLNAEAALLATKADVTEELGRLTAHVAAAREHLSTGGAIGRNLDFLAQEFNREANTLCSKSPSTGLTAIGLELKSVIDQLREQVQNLQ